MELKSVADQGLRRDRDRDLLTVPGALQYRPYNPVACRQRQAESLRWLQLVVMILIRSAPQLQELPLTLEADIECVQTLKVLLLLKCGSGWL